MNRMKSLRRSGILFCCAAALSLSLRPATADDDVAAIQVVERLHTGLLQAMHGGTELGHAGRRELLAPIVNATFDFVTISRIVLGTHWASLTEQQRRDFMERFAALTTATYASNFSSYGGETFTTNGSEHQASSVIVHTQLHTGTETIRFDYVLRGPDWHIVNVLAQGVSDIALKRAEYSAVIASQGFDALLAKLDEKIRQLIANG